MMRVSGVRLSRRCKHGHLTTHADFDLCTVSNHQLLDTAFDPVVKSRGCRQYSMFVKYPYELSQQSHEQSAWLHPVERHPETDRVRLIPVPSAQRHHRLSRHTPAHRDGLCLPSGGGRYPVQILLCLLCAAAHLPPARNHRKPNSRISCCFPAFCEWHG